MRTHYIPSCKRNLKDIPIMPPVLALRLTLISSNYPCLEHISVDPGVFKQLKFYCIYFCMTALFRLKLYTMLVKAIYIYTAS